MLLLVQVSSSELSNAAAALNSVVALVGGLGEYLLGGGIKEDLIVLYKHIYNTGESW